MKSKTFIYGLKEANSDEIKYIGKADNPKNRLIRHKSDAKRNNKTKKEKWIVKCIKNNIKIDIVILEEVEYSKWPKSEMYWIEKYGLKKLKNHSNGGKGGNIKKYKITYDSTKEWISINLPQIDSQTKWNKNKKYLPNFIPKKPDLVFKNNGWVSWGDFLTTNNISNNKKIFLSYEECKLFAKENNINSQSNWAEFIKVNKKTIPTNVPKSPEHVYKNKGWVSWSEFLDNNFIHHSKISYVDFKTLKEEVKKYGVKTKNNFYIFKKTLKKINGCDIPSHPERVYKNNWLSWTDFLTEN